MTTATYRGARVTNILCSCTAQEDEDSAKTDRCIVWKLIVIICLQAKLIQMAFRLSIVRPILKRQVVH